MRIGILTLPLHTNYGGILQAYALQTVLERMGHEVMVIDKKRAYRLPIWKAPFVYAKRILKNICGENIPVFFEQKLLKEKPVIRQNTDKFIKRYIHLLSVDDYSLLKSSDFDAIVVGSDQVWRPLYFRKIEDAYLGFAKDWDIRRIAYAASFGTDEWEYSKKQTKLCKELLKRFDAVSVREKSAVELCMRYFAREASHVLDPTMLLSADDYIRHFDLKAMPKSQGTLLCYFLDASSEKNAVADKIAKETGLLMFNVNAKVEDWCIPVEKKIQPPVESWLKGFYDAEFVVTDSFHACVFSLIFNKPFIVVTNKERGICRISSLLEDFDLKDRLVYTIADLNIDLKNICYDNINSIIRIKRKESMDSLLSSLG